VLASGFRLEISRRLRDMIGSIARCIARLWTGQFDTMALA
jgi:hypothetical protein